MGLAVVNSGKFVGTSSQTLACPLGWTPTAGNCVVVCVGARADGGSANPSVSDNQGNSYTRKMQAFDGPVTIDGSVHFAKNVASSGSWTITATANAGTTPATLLVVVLEISGADLSNPMPDAGSSSGSGTAPAPGALTNSNANSVFLGFAVDVDTSASATLTPPGGSWVSQQSNTNGSSGCVGSVVTQIVSSVGGQNPTWTSASVTWAAIVVTVQAGLQAVAVTDPNIFYSPWNWRFNGSSWAQSYCAGAYLKIGFSGTSLTMTVDTSVLAGGAASAYPVLTWTVDQGRWSAPTRLTSGQSSVAIASGLTSGNHTAWIFCAGLVNNNGAVDQWNASAAPFIAWRVTGFEIDQGSSTLAYPLRGKRMLFYGDSITAGYDEDTLPSGGGTNDYAAQYSYAEPLASGLYAEWGMVAYGSARLCTSDVFGNNIPGLYPTSGTGYWDHIDAVTSRLVGGLLSPQPDYIFVNIGTNDNSVSSGATVLAQLNAFAQALVAAAPNARTFWVIPYGRQFAAQFLAMTLPDNHSIIDCDAGYPNDPLSAGFGPGVSSSFRSVDGVHPHNVGTIESSARVMAAIQTVVVDGGSAGHNVNTGGTGVY